MNFTLCFLTPKNAAVLVGYNQVNNTSIIDPSMPMNALSDLPVEVHFEILKYAFYSSQRTRSSHNEPILLGWRERDERNPQSVEWEWVEPDKRKPSQFPYNVAAVCRLWLAILTKIPECWTRVIINVASDPHDFLDIFLWSKDLPKLAVTITNSHIPDPEDVDYSALERRRVSAIVDALRPHVSRCQTITFEVAFLTSLPSPMIFLHKDAPHLTDLVLECKIDNAGPPDDYSRSCDLGICELLQTPKGLFKGFNSALPKLTHLSMTGFWFMFIASHPYTANWWRKHRNSYSSLCISRFEFQTEGEYTLQNFIVPYTELKSSDLTLCDLSLNYDGPIPGLKGKNVEFAPIESSMIMMTFKNVSSDVLKSLFFLVNISPTYLTFDNCFPDVPLKNATYLTLKNISSSGSANSAATANNKGFCNFLANWPGFDLTVDSCPSFDDNALLALAHRENSPQSLRIFNSPNFTVYGLRLFLAMRNNLSAEPPSRARPNYRPLNNLEIKSGCPLPSEEELEWFQTSLYTRPINITWSA